MALVEKQEKNSDLKDYKIIDKSKSILHRRICICNFYYLPQMVLQRKIIKKGATNEINEKKLKAASWK